MSLVFSGRRLSGPPLPTIEGQGCGAVGGGGSEVGLPGPLHVGSSTLCGSHSSAELFPFDHQGEGSPGRVGGIDRQRGCRARPCISRLLQSPVHGPEGFGVVEACYRPVVVERFCPANAVQDGVKPVSAPVHQELRLDDLHRSQRCIPSGSNSPGQQEVFEICGRRQSLPVQGSLYWPLHCPSSVHRVMAPVLSFLHSQDVRMLRYLDDWLILASSHLEARDKVM